MPNTGNKRTEISSLGEFGLIDDLMSTFTNRQPTTLKGVGDDAAVIKNDKETTVVSTDLLIEGVHFDLTYAPLKHLGYKAAAVNFSDMAAMNVKPQQIVIGIALSNRFSLEAIEEFYAGLRFACEEFEVDLIGGDTTSSQSGLMISITVMGQADKDEIVYRSGAQENDLVCVTGDLGAAYTGLLLLEREKQEFLANPNMQPDLQGFDYVLQRQLKPTPRVDMVDIFAQLKIKPTSMIDISDGLASEILHICKESKKGCHLYDNKIPIDPTTCTAADLFKINPLVAALNGGEDYELLFTVKQEDFDKINGIAGISIIGHITEENAGCMLVPTNGPMVPITAQGWDSFREN